LLIALLAILLLTLSSLLTVLLFPLLTVLSVLLFALLSVLPVLLVALFGVLAAALFSLAATLLSLAAVLALCKLAHSGLLFAGPSQQPDRQIALDVLAGDLPSLPAVLPSYLAVNSAEESLGEVALAVLADRLSTLFPVLADQRLPLAAVPSDHRLAAAVLSVLLRLGIRPGNDHKPACQQQRRAPDTLRYG
jgi:hypothetical protein